MPRKNLNRTEALKSPEVHDLTKEVLTLSAGRDAVDRYFDVSLALDILRDEMNEACGIEKHLCVAPIDLLTAAEDARELLETIQGDGFDPSESPFEENPKTSPWSEIEALEAAINRAKRALQE